MKFTTNLKNIINTALAYVEKKALPTLFSAMFLIFLFLLVRNAGMPPLVSTDEAFYRTFSALRSIETSPIPGYIFLHIYSLTRINADNYLAIARFLNESLYTLSAVFIYLTARNYYSRVMSVYLASISLLAAANVYTINYMPEASFFFFFWLFCWHFITYGASGSHSRLIVSGILLAVVSLVKPHAMLLVPAIVIFLFLVRRNKGGRWMRDGIWACVVLLIGTSGNRRDGCAIRT